MCKTSSHFSRTKNSAITREKFYQKVGKLSKRYPQNALVKNSLRHHLFVFLTVKTYFSLRSLSNTRGIFIIYFYLIKAKSRTVEPFFHVVGLSEKVEMERLSYTIATPLGKILTSAEKGAITGLWFIGQKYFPPGVSPKSTAIKEPVFLALENWLEDYFAGKNRKPEFRLNPKGTAFQEAVWKLLLKIPYGKTTTYGELAKKIAARQNRTSMSAQAIGGAVGRNPISILIPCHRVIGADGKLTGYAAGLDKKVALLQLESDNRESFQNKAFTGK